MQEESRTPIQPANRDWLAALLLRQPDPFLTRLAAGYARLRLMPRRWRGRIQRRAAASVTAAALLLAMAGTPLLVPTLHAATITVDDGMVDYADDGYCSLREAFHNAGADGQMFSSPGECGPGTGDDVIVLPAGGDFVFEHFLDNSPYGQVGLIVANSTLSIEGNGSTIRRDPTSDEAFGILVVFNADLTLRDVTLTGGKADFGGGILSVDSDVRLFDSTISNNEASVAAGGVLSYLGDLHISGSTISNNYAYRYGGGITMSSGTLEVVNSTISGNSAGAAAGIGIALPFSNPDEPTHATLTNSTVTGNDATEIVGGIAVLPPATLTINHSIISGNTAQGENPRGTEIYNVDYSTPIYSLYSVFGDAGKSDEEAFYNFAPSGSSRNATSDGANIPLGDILNPTLADNGGPTLTHALVPGSPAIDIDATGPATDQRGVTRPQGAGYDAGAFELEAPVSQYDFTGFFAPVDSPPLVNRAKAGSAIPVKFSLGGDFGLDILAAGSPGSVTVGCEGGTPADAIEETVKAGSSSLQYDPATGVYTYVWKTDKKWANSCRQLQLTLSDGSVYVADFKFAK